MDFPDTNEFLLKSLAYPTYARGEFLINQQLRSGWSLQTFIQALYGSLSYYQILLHLHKGENRILILKVDKNSLAEDGKRELRDIPLSSEVINDMRWAIKQAADFANLEPKYNSLEILMFIEKGLAFILGEFEFQAGKKTRLFEQNSKVNKEGENIQVLYHYYSISRVPLFDFFRYKNEVRYLLLNANNPEKLQLMLKPVFDVCLKIINLWNDNIYLLEEHSGNSVKTVYENYYFNFDEITQDIIHYIDTEFDSIQKQPHIFYTNKNFAFFASHIASLISTEVLNSKTTQVPEVIEKINYKRLEELFSVSEDFQGCVDILRRVKPAVINSKNQFLLGQRSKGAIVAWFAALRQKGKIYYADRMTLSFLASQFFKGVNFGKDGKTLDNIHTTAYKKYYNQILALLP